MLSSKESMSWSALYFYNCCSINQYTTLNCSGNFIYRNGNTNSYMQRRVDKMAEPGYSEVWNRQ
jgi:hypothetical protein